MTPPTGPISLRISLTSRCELRCTYCAPACGTTPCEGLSLSAAQIVRFVRVVRESWGLTKVHLTGGEPLLRRDVVEIVRQVAEMGIADLALTSNGQKLASMVEPLHQAGLRRVNVSLDSLDARSYATISHGGRLDATLAGIRRAVDRGMRVKLNTVVLRGLNDGEVVDIAGWALRHGCEARFLELMPIGPAAGMWERLFVPSWEVRSRLATAFDLRPLDEVASATARRFMAHDAGGRSGPLGFISADSEPFCAGCRRLRLTESGHMVGCLALGRGPDVGEILRAQNPRDDDLLRGAVREALELKRSGDHFTTGRLMAHTGG